MDTIDFLVMCPLFGASPPVITLTGFNNVELILGFTHIDDGATASDTGDGDLTNNIVVGGLPVDTSTIDTFFVTFDVTDSAGNDALQVVRSVTTVKRSPTGSGDVIIAPTVSDIPPISLIPSQPPHPPTRTLDEVIDLYSVQIEEVKVEPIPTLEVVPESVTEIPPPLSQPTPTPTELPTRTLDEIFDLFSFLFREVEPTPTLEFVPEPESVTDIPAPLFEPIPTEEIRPNFIESIQSFFTSLFG